jgi:DNA-binding NarL/FixJ family response regulator
MQPSDGLFMPCEAAQERRGESRILIVDDVGVVRANLRDWLAAIFPSVEVLEAASGEEAVGLVESQGARVVVMDVALPGISGIEASRRILAIQPGIRVVMLTIHEELEYRREAESAGACAYVFKRRMASDLIPVLTRLMAAGASEGFASRGAVPGERAV